MSTARTFVLLLASMLPACVSWESPDTDGDGFLTSEGDCDDLNPNVGPGAAEIWYDGVDQDCDGNDADQDLDGFLSVAVGGTDCWDDPTAIPTDFSVVSGQGFSQPAAGDVNPEGHEVWYDDVDQDCDGASDFDQDGDGYLSLEHPDRDGAVGDDCVDNSEQLDALMAADDWSYSGTITAAGINPGVSAEEDACYDGLNLDCLTREPADGNSFPQDYAPDNDCDLDGFHQATDCDDADAAVFPDPSVEEVWYNGVDENCDNNDGDQDLDGHESWVVGGEDCWDDPGEIREGYEALNGFAQPDAADVSPDGIETWYDGVDADCAGDDDFDADLDGQATDAYADRDSVTGTDCDDADSSSYLYATEYCDDVDHDCDGLIETDDDAVDAVQYYFDSDDDGYGVSTSKFYCQPVDEFRADNADDCDDDDASEYPGAPEYCDGDDDDCDGDIDEDDSVDAATWYRDSDGDGYGDPATTDVDCYEPTGFLADDTDCDDTDGAEFPGAPEYCDGDDDDCDDEIDEDDSVDVATWYEDSDGDGYGNLSSTDIDCYEPTGFLADSTDCDDTDGAEYPGADEYCDGDDDDCDNSVDEDDSVDVVTWYSDSDGDGYGNAAVSQIDCDQPASYVVDDTDCDDADFDINPAATEICDLADNDCDDAIDDADPSVDYTSVTVYYVDVDNDGYGDETDGGTPYCAQPAGTRKNNSDCDDGEAAVNPSAIEVCDGGIDNDCSGAADDADSGVDYSGEVTYYLDTDGDGYGDESDPGEKFCLSYSGYSALNSDCDDGATGVNPAATEVCDDIDNDCDEAIDDDDGSTNYEGETTYYVDVDGDGYGDEDDSGTPYCDQPASTSTTVDDCNDGNGAINVAATEVCDGADNDCDSASDEGFDSDGDGTPDCQDGEDCDGLDNDGDGNVDEGYDSDSDGIADCFDTEECDGVDNDGDGLVDDDDGDVDLATATNWYDDLDGDGYGDETDPSILQCDAPTDNDHVANNGDCDDGVSAVNPAATEVCDGIDNDCNDDVDDDDSGVDYGGATVYYTDADNDGYGDKTDSGATFCDQPALTSTIAQDCDDGVTDVNPAATEICDGIDNDCDDDVDDADANVDLDGEVTYYVDGDGDGYGSDADPGTRYCDQPTGTVADNSDCDDGEFDVNTAATEECDGFDNDCDTKIDDLDDDTDYTGEVTYYVDLDGDGDGDDGDAGQKYCSQPGDSSTNADDCDDGNVNINLAAAEVCDASNTDENCNNLADDDDGTTDYSGVVDYYVDSDEDGFGDETDPGVPYCDPDSSVVTDNTDCDDGDDTEFPTVTWYADIDLDGYGNPASSSVCERAAGTDVTDATDCDDGDPAENPSVTWYADDDLDGYGDAASSNACEKALGSDVTDATDCDDGDAAENPAATWYPDVDGDGYGDPSSSNACERAGGSDVADNTDCDDGDAAENPAVTWYADGDGDGYGDSSSSSACERAAGADVTDATDCDDGDGDEYPGVTWYPDVDLDGFGDSSSSSTCDRASSTDVTDNTDCDDADGDEYPGVTWYPDVDADGFGGSTPSGTCERAVGSDVTDNTDCDDADGDEYPGVTWYADSDGDGFGDGGSSSACDRANLDDVTDDSDCDDTDEDEYPGVTWYPDADLDGYGVDSSSQSCERAGPNDVTDATDCDDGDITVNPGETETATEIDNDCDDMVDEGLRLEGDLVISEIMANPAGTEPDNEWLELYNTTGAAIDPGGVYVTTDCSSGFGFTLPKETLSIASGGYVVLCSSDTTLGASCDYIYGSDEGYSSSQGATFSTGFCITNGGSTLDLDLAGTSLDAVTFTGSTPWPSDTNGESIMLITGKETASQNDNGSSWCHPAASEEYDATNGNLGSPGSLGTCE